MNKKIKIKTSVEIKEGSKKGGAQSTTFYLTLSAVFAALIFLSTYLLHINVYSGNYVHLGDGIILLAAVIFPKKRYAAVAAVIGASLADIISGFAIWAPATFIIKALMVLVFVRRTSKIVSVNNILFALIAGIVNIIGYYIAEGIIYFNFTAPLVMIPLNALQSLSGILVFVLVGLVLDKSRVLDKLNKQM